MLNASQIVKEIQSKYKIIGRSEELKKIILARSVDKNLIIEGQVGTGKTRYLGSPPSESIACERRQSPGPKD